ncbi:hypothetical protein H2O64_09810 [Kordia sp. YSTF-M3]|uniref:Bacteriocin n=1 Tax=Kordia aestuariivivens TaxID=2759037 RepID=A0ABR7Q8S3_9FLAO|nr:hypothetical protein [Kordia aestuariivivens]MBC8754966.1 hypothetical protein [Kordia aestuariivivens]
MKKRNLKSLLLKKEKVSKLSVNSINGGGAASSVGPTCVIITVIWCPTIHCSEGVCGSIP